MRPTHVLDNGRCGAASCCWRQPRLGRCGRLPGRRQGPFLRQDLGFASGHRPLVHPCSRCGTREAFSENSFGCRLGARRGIGAGVCADAPSKMAERCSSGQSQGRRDPCEVKADPLEDSRRICLVGVGVNCNQKEQPLELADRAISVRQVVDCRISRLRLLESFLRVFHRLLQDDCWRPELERRLFGIGRWVVVRRVAGQDLSGILVGLAEDGALLVAERGEERPPTPVYTGELATGPHLDPDRF